jgi:hypothetical protein
VNPFAELGRAKKVDRIVEAIDTELLSRDMSPYSPRVLDKLLARFGEMSPEAWRDLCGKHAVRKPSPETVAAVVTTYRSRLESVRRVSAA